MMKDFRAMVEKAAWNTEAITVEEMTDYKEVVINACYGGFSIPEEVYPYLDVKLNEFGYYDEPNRDDAKLIDCVKKNMCPDLVAAVIPSCYNYTIDEYDGLESIRLLPKKAVIKDLINDSDSLIAYLDAIGLFQE